MGNSESKHHDKLWKKKQSYYNEIQKVDTVLEPGMFS